MLPKIKKILYASDLGDNTRPVSRLAVALAQQHGADIVMLHTLEPVGSYGRALIETYVSSEDLDTVIEEGRERVLAKMKQRLEHFCREELEGSEDLSAHVTELVVREGPAGEVIVQEAAKNAIDLVVVGTHRGTGSLRRVLIGSTARYVTQHARCPVLVVPTD